MRLSEIQGNDAIKKAFAGMMSSGRIPHAILLHEDDGGGAILFAIAFLQYLYCKNPGADDSCGVCPNCNKISKMIHPDVRFIFPVGAGNSSSGLIPQWRELVSTNPYFTESDLNSITGAEGKLTHIAVAESKELLQSLSLSSLEGGYNSVVIYLPEKMNAESANRLLKVIEEPPALTQFVMITHAPEKVLPTIRSRCQQIRVMPQGHKLAENEEFAPLLTGLMSAALMRNLPETLEAAESIAALPSRESAKAFCKFASEKFRLVFLYQQGLDRLAPDDGQCAMWAQRTRKTFPRTALAALDRTVLRIERNVNLKILFTDLADRLFTGI